MFRLIVLIFVFLPLTAFSDIRYEGKATTPIIIVAGKTYTYENLIEGSPTRHIEGNEHIITFKFKDGYEHHQSHFHGKPVRKTSVPSTPGPVSTPQPTDGEVPNLVDTDISVGETPESQPPAETDVEQRFAKILSSPASTMERKAATLEPLRITEYMVRDWTAGIGGLPQWIEVYNPNTEAVNLKGWTFQYATRRSANAPHKVHTLTLAATADGFSIPGAVSRSYLPETSQPGDFPG